MSELPRVSPGFERPGVRRWIAIARDALAYLVVPNVGFGLLTHFNTAVRAAVDVDYLLLGAIAPWLRPASAAGLYIALLVLDAASSFANVYHFRQTELLLAIPEALRLNAVIVAPVAVLALAIAAVATRLLLSTGRGPVPVPRTRSGVLAGAACVVAVLDLLSGPNRFALSGVALFPVNVGTSGAFAAVASGYSALVDRPRARWHQALGPAESAAGFLRVAALESDDTDVLPGRVALVVVESLGLFVRPDANEALRAPFHGLRMRARYEVRTGSVPFTGSTTRAELRELCGLRGDYRTVERDLPSCLPWLLRRRGYRTVAVHGFTKRFFERERWYPKLGFEETLFLEDSALARTSERCGGVFRGVCDHDAARVFARRLQGGPPEERRFVYWLTLNSHLPIARSGSRIRASTAAMTPMRGGSRTCARSCG